MYKTAITISLPTELLEQIDKICGDTGATRTGWIKMQLKKVLGTKK